TRCRFDPQSQRVATVSADRGIKLWDMKTRGTTVSINSNHNNVVSDCCFTNNGHFLCTASWDKSLKLWDLQSGHEGSVSSCSFSVDAHLLVSGSYDRTVALWDMSTSGHSDWVTDVSVSADRKLVASASKVPNFYNQIYILLFSQCEQCGKPFPVSRLQTSDLLTQCVFCRLKSPSRYRPQPPPLL
uniref:Uncharacterized protein n=1 Tax=Labrus bergylta TaxID=56723 RepID=A0A3Q3GVG5_9LABR